MFQNIKGQEVKGENKVYLKTVSALEAGQENVVLFPEFLIMDKKHIMEEVERAQKNSASSIYLKGTQLGFFRLKFLYGIPKDELSKKRDILTNKVEEIVKDIELNNMDDYNRIKAAHDYVIDNVRYDFSIDESNLQVFSESHDAYGALINGIAVCDGYAKALKVILDGLGINSTLVYGTGDGLPHTWNIVEVEEDYYHIDSTWNDPEYNNEMDSRIYNYFMMKDEDISQSHVWNRSYYPACNSEKYNYYFHEGLVAYNKEEIIKLVMEAAVRGDQSFSFRMINIGHNEPYVEAVLKDAIRLSGKEINQFSYIYNPNMDYVTVIFGGE